MNEFLTSPGIAAPMLRAKAIIKTYDTVCKKCGLNMKDLSFELWRPNRKYQKCEHDWEDVLVKTEIIGGENAFI